MIFKYEEVRDERKNQIASNTNIRLNNVNPSGENVVPDNLKNHANFIICGGRGPSAGGRPPVAVRRLPSARGRPPVAVRWMLGLNVSAQRLFRR